MIESRLIPVATVINRTPRVPVLKRLIPDRYGMRLVENQQDMSEGLLHLDIVLNEYCRTGTPFVIVNMGLPKSGKTILAGEQLALATRKLQDHFLRQGRRGDFRNALTYIAYEDVQDVVCREGQVPAGHGPGHQTLDDHRISSERMAEEIRHSLAGGQNVIAEAPFIAGRGELEMIFELATHTGRFAGLNYNARFMWPIPDNLLAVCAMATRVDFEGENDRAAILRTRNVRVHSLKSDTIKIPGATESVLQANYNPDAQSFLIQIQSGLKNLGLGVEYLDCLLGSRESGPSGLALLAYLRKIAPTLLALLGVPPEHSVVGTNSATIEPIEYYTGLLKYYDKFAMIPNS